MLRAVIQDVLDEQVAQSTLARELVAELDGRIISVTLRDLHLTLLLYADADGVHVLDGWDGEPDATLVTTVRGLFALATAEARGAMQAGQLEIRGDAVVAQRFGKLLKTAAPDLEEAIAKVAGEDAARPIANALRSFMSWSRDALDALAGDVGEYVTEESRIAVGRNELEDFNRSVDRVRDATDRLEARLRHAERGT
jgi:ubiquinone biosynthesis accessory factor UbiJ